MPAVPARKPVAALGGDAQDLDRRIHLARQRLEPRRRRSGRTARGRSCSAAAGSRGAEHVRVLERLVLALGDRGDHHLGALAEVEQRRADQVADVLDEQHRAGARVELGAAPRATIAASRWQPVPVLICTARHAGRADALGVVSRSPDRPRSRESGKRPPRSRRVRSRSVVLPAPGELDQVQRQDAAAGEASRGCARRRASFFARRSRSTEMRRCWSVVVVIVMVLVIVVVLVRPLRRIRRSRTCQATSTLLDAQLFAALPLQIGAPAGAPPERPQELHPRAARPALRALPALRRFEAPHLPPACPR